MIDQIFVKPEERGG